MKKLISSIMVASCVVGLTVGIWCFASAPGVEANEIVDVRADPNSIVWIMPVVDHNEHSEFGSWVVSSETIGGRIEIVCNKGVLEASGSIDVLINVLYDYLMKLPPNTHIKPVIFKEKQCEQQLLF